MLEALRGVEWNCLGLLGVCITWARLTQLRPK